MVREIKIYNRRDLEKLTKREFKSRFWDITLLINKIKQKLEILEENKINVNEINEKINLINLKLIDLERIMEEKLK